MTTSDASTCRTCGVVMEGWQSMCMACGAVRELTITTTSIPTGGYLAHRRAQLAEAMKARRASLGLSPGVTSETMSHGMSKVVQAGFAPTPHNVPFKTDARVPLRSLNRPAQWIEAVRCASERQLAQALAQAMPRAVEGAAASGEIEAEQIQREMLTNSLRLTPSMAPDVHQTIADCARRLGVDLPVEVYQSGGALNAGVLPQVRSHALLSFSGPLLHRLRGPTLASVVGHELGHFLAHGPDCPLHGAYVVMHALLRDDDAPPVLRAVGARLSMAKEFTADRFGLLACDDLDAALQVNMALVSGLPTEALVWDTASYLAQCVELVEMVLADGQMRLSTHPEHSMRAYAIWLFSETREYRQMTGRGTGARDLAAVDSLLQKLLEGAGTADGADNADPAGRTAGLLAAAAWVALSDGPISAPEREFLEQAFSDALPDWADRLTMDWAKACMTQAAPGLAQGGVRVGEGMFMLLIQLILADGDINEPELEALMQVGEMIGQQELFIAMLSGACIPGGEAYRAALAPLMGADK